MNGNFLSANFRILKKDQESKFGNTRINYERSSRCPLGKNRIFPLIAGGERQGYVINGPQDGIPQLSPHLLGLLRKQRSLGVVCAPQVWW